MKNVTTPMGLYYQFPFVDRKERAQLLSWLETLHPLWEMRFSEHNPPPEGDEQRPLLRPVYWLGNWQFACLDYYHPPKGILHRCVRAETYPPLLQKLVDRIEFIAKKRFPKSYFPEKWKLNTCLINFYGNKFEDGKWVDRARVGEHKDFEPGPVGSLSLGDRAFFQFVNGKSSLGEDNIVFSQWLEDSSLQIFGGDKWKTKTFHRVQRVEDKRKEVLGPKIENFQTRRINFTFRYVPEEHIYQLKDMPAPKLQDIRPYLETLALHSSYFKKLITP
ncbi:alpha-ketoglutarate-dependent dioxygenase AlkB [Peredibacter sp. HCB2-198]|uniref:alpha-ketoglutarate-dependent dioxygenase AlkB n=1 Tax=Peredibacter sp. HCB2-198 TaxID=3383025 RepID=UPI0038B67D0C